MKLFTIGECQLVTTKQQLETFLHDTYNRFYKKERLKHIANHDKRLPHIKITEDILSFSVWFKDRSGKEHRFIIDGAIFLNEIQLTTITLEHQEVNDLEYRAYTDCLKSLTTYCHGYILVSIGGKPCRIQKGSLESQKKLLDELFQKIPNEQKGEVEAIFHWLVDCSSKRTV